MTSRDEIERERVEAVLEAEQRAMEAHEALDGKETRDALPWSTKAVDVSGNQGKLGTAGWKAIADAGYAAGWSKATEAASYRHRAHGQWVAWALNHCGDAGAYHFAQPARVRGQILTDARQEAEHFLKHASPKSTLRPWLDLEVSNGLDAGELASWVQVWCDVVRQEWCEPILYTYASFWRHQLKGAPGLRDLDVLVAAYPFDVGPDDPRHDTHRVYEREWVGPSKVVQKMIGDGVRVVGQQWSGQGDVEGIKPRVDLNRLWVPLAELRV